MTFHPGFSGTVPETNLRPGLILSPFFVFFLFYNTLQITLFRMENFWYLICKPETAVNSTQVYTIKNMM